MLTSNTGRIISRKEPQYRLNMRIRGLRIRSGCFEKKENLLTLRDFELRTARFAAQALYPLRYSDAGYKYIQPKQFGIFLPFSPPFCFQTLTTVTGLLATAVHFNCSLAASCPPPNGATGQGGPWPPLQYASRPLGSLLCLSIRLHPSFSGPWTRHPAISFLVFLFVSLRTAFRASFFWDFDVLKSFYTAKPSYSLAFYKSDKFLSLDYGF